MLLQGFEILPIGKIYFVNGFPEFNHLVTLNGIFSNYPRFNIVDRTQTVKNPINHYVGRPWAIPDQKITLDQAAQSRVNDIVNMHSGTITVLWSGGIDSTFIVTAFLKHRPRDCRLRVLYSPWSTYEHPAYLDFLKTHDDVECVDISGEVYMSLDHDDAVYVVGDGGDESHASLDESFIESHGWEVLNQSWVEFFKKLGHSEEFIEFCKKFFSHSGRPIDTVLEARWWFYLICKFDGTFSETKIPFFTNNNGGTEISKLIRFFDTDHYQKFIYFNTDKIVADSDYTSWRQILKDYCCEFDGLVEWKNTHRKVNSRQFMFYSLKKLSLTDQRWLMILEDGTRIATPSLPLFSAKEFRNRYGNTLDYLFNHD